MDGAHGGSGRPARFATAMKRNLLIGMCLLLVANIGAKPPIQSKPAKESTLVRGMSFVAIDAWLFDNPAIVKPAYSGGISYHFTPHFGIFAEGGYGSKFFGCGISYCFRDPLSKYLGGASGRYDF